MKAQQIFLSYNRSGQGYAALAQVDSRYSVRG